MIMISETPTNEPQVLQPMLTEEHRRTMHWYNSATFWKRELAFFQTLLDQYAPKSHSVEDKKRIDHFQNLIIYYNGEVIDLFLSKLHDDGKMLARMSASDEENDKNMRNHHDLMEEVEIFNKQFVEYKDELYDFIEGVK